MRVAFPIASILVACATTLLGVEETRTIRFRTVCFEMAPGEREVVASGDPTLRSTAEVKLGRRLASHQQEIEIARRSVVLGTRRTNSEGIDFIEPMASAKLPSSGDQFLFFLVPNGKRSGEVYRCLVLSDDPRDFPPGGIRLVNMSPQRLRFALGKERIELGPGGIKMLEEVAGTGPDQRFPYVAQYHDGNAWNRLSTGYWMQRSHIRSLQVAFRDPRTDRLAMRGYDDTLILRKSAKR